LAARRTLEEEQALGLELVSYLGVDGPVGADRLRNIPAEDLLAAADRLPTDHYFDAAIDGDILPADLLLWLDKARLSGVEIILGTNADEWLMYIDENATSEDLGQWIRDHAPQHRDELLDAVSDEPDPRRKLDRVTTAHDMLCASRYLAERINDAGGRGWIYLFSRQRSGKGGDKLGAYHGAELPYVFDSHDAWLPVEKADRRLTDAVQDYWLHFAKTGKPAPEGQPAWPVYTRENPLVLELGEAVKLRKSETGSLCGIFRAASIEGTE
jgi:para-nitrobenzyl esterase